MAEASSFQVNLVAKAVNDVSKAVRDVDMQVREVSGQVHQLQAQQMTMDQRLAQLADDFAAFLSADAMQKTLQLAETRQVKVRQEVETRYGHYREVRRRAVGILQAVDAGVITHKAIQATTEDVMMRTPGYWLAPALVALAAWIRDDQRLAHRAVHEALQRDDHKTSLFFALVLRRYRREQASAVWVRRYFANQHPERLDRDCMTVLDAITNGGFGPTAQQMTRSHVTEWVARLSATPGFAAQQRDRWKNALLGLLPPVTGEYTYLPKYCGDWPQLGERLARAHLHRNVGQFFYSAFDGELPMSPRLADEVDAILESLVTHFDDEELPLRKLERELQLIIEHGGDSREASSRFANEVAAFEENVDFAALLTNASMHREQSGASPATQRFAIALSRDWIIDAYDKVTAEGRQSVPDTVRLKIDGWLCTSTMGADEAQLLTQQTAEYERRVRAARDAVTVSPAAWAAALFGALFLVLAVTNRHALPLILALVGFAYCFFEWQRLGRLRQEAEARVRAAHEGAAKTLKACMAELVDWQREWHQADAIAEAARAQIAAIAPVHHTKRHHSDGRGVMSA